MKKIILIPIIFMIFYCIGEGSEIGNPLEVREEDLKPGICTSSSSQCDLNSLKKGTK